MDDSNVSDSNVSLVDAVDPSSEITEAWQIPYSELTDWVRWGCLDCFVFSLFFVFCLFVVFFPFSLCRSRNAGPHRRLRQASGGSFAEPAFFMAPVGFARRFRQSR